MMIGAASKQWGQRDDAKNGFSRPALFGINRLHQHRLGRVWLGGDGAQSNAGNGIYCVYAAVFLVWDLP